MANATAGEACAARPETMAPPNVLKYVDGLYEEYPGEVLRVGARHCKRGKLLTVTLCW